MRHTSWGGRVRSPSLASASAILLAIFLITCTVGPLFAQNSVLRGRVVDPEGRPVAGITVTLHHVTEGGGAEVGRALSDQAGTFAIEASEEAAGGVYFAATRFEGALYMGTPLRSFAEAGDDYRIVIGEGGFAGGPAVGQPSGSGGGQGWVVLLLLALLGGAAVVIPLRRARRGPLALRSILSELAELEEGHARRTAEARQAAEGEYQELRDALRARLLELSGAPVHAADHH